MPAAAAENLTNEAGVGGTTRLLKNVMGLWIIQQCNEVWKLDYAELYAQAERVRVRPLHRPRRRPLSAARAATCQLAVQAYCRETGQPAPQTPAEIARCVLDSLALRCAEVLATLEAVSGQNIDTVHVVGGGSQIALLNQLIADASGKTVVAGPVEATLMGNLLVQALGQGDQGKLRARGAGFRRTAHLSAAGVYPGGAARMVRPSG